MAKISKSFRFSVQAQEYLRQLVSQTGSSETAILEMSLASFYKLMQGQSAHAADLEPGIPEPDFPDDFDDTVIGVSTPVVKNQPAGSSRKRHKPKHY